MRPVLAWLKSNPVTVASILVVLLSFGFLYWVSSRGAALEERMAARNNQANNIAALISRSVNIPPKDPDAPMETMAVTVDPEGLEWLKQLYGRMDDEYTKVFEVAVETNRGNHKVLVENLFPETTDPALPFQAREAYIDAFRELLMDPSQPGEGRTRVRLDAGLPPPPEELNAEITRVESDFRNSPGMIGAALRPEDEQVLQKEKSAKAIEVLKDRARQIHIYAEPNLVLGQQTNVQQFPFAVQPWALDPTGGLPKPHQLWEGQLELWIQEDIARAIAAANNAENEAVSVLEAPVKRLIKCDVVPGYVGLHTRGGLYPETQVARSADGLYAAPLGGQTGEANRRLSDNFYLSPTGRSSNALYDVRHVRLSVLVDVQQLPEFFEALTRTNFMTVLEIDLTDIDEYEDLKQGFVYGNGDVARADMVIETIWLRDWTQSLMPKLTRQYVGIDPATDLTVDPNAGQMMGPMMPGDYGGYGGYGGYGPPDMGGYGPPPQ